MKIDVITEMNSQVISLPLCGTRKCCQWLTGSWCEGGRSLLLPPPLSQRKGICFLPFMPSLTLHCSWATCVIRLSPFSPAYGSSPNWPSKQGMTPMGRGKLRHHPLSSPASLCFLTFLTHSLTWPPNSHVVRHLLSCSFLGFWDDNVSCFLGHVLCLFFFFKCICF